MEYKKQTTVRIIYANVPADNVAIVSYPVIIAP